MTTKNNFTLSGLVGTLVVNAFIMGGTAYLFAHTAGAEATAKVSGFSANA